MALGEHCLQKKKVANKKEWMCLYWKGGDTNIGVSEAYRQAVQCFNRDLNFREFQAYETWYLLYNKDGNLLPLPTHCLGFQVCTITTKQVGFFEVTNLIIMNARPVTIRLKVIWLAFDIYEVCTQ